MYPYLQYGALPLGHGARFGDFGLAPQGPVASGQLYLEREQLLVPLAAVLGLEPSISWVTTRRPHLVDHTASRPFNEVWELGTFVAGHPSDLCLSNTTVASACGASTGN